MDTLIKQVLETKGADVWSVTPGTPARDGLALMAQKEIGALAVMENERLIGIVTERDYARKLALEGRSVEDTPVGDIMTTQVVYVRPDQRIDECMALMTDKRTRHLPVLEGDTLAGIVSIGDLVKHIISEQEYLIHQLENYIKS